MENISEVEKETNVVEIHPLTKGKRAILFLADLFVSFMFSVFFFSLAVLPLGKVIINYDNIVKENETSYITRNKILIENEILFYDANQENTIANFNMCNAYTFTNYTKQLLNLADNKYDVFKNYYVTILDDENKYNEIFNNKFFSSKNSLKTEYFNAFLSFFDELNTPSETEKKMYDEFLNSFYLPAYAGVIYDINNNDLTATINGVNYSYIALNKQMAANENIYTLLITVCVFISYILAWAICFILVPFINKNGKTIGMLMLGIERINFDHLKLLKKWDKLVVAIFNFATNAFQILFIPMMSVNFNFIFSLPSIFPVALISLILILTSTITMFVTNFNQTLFDKLSRSFCLKTEALDEIYRKKGYLV